MTRKGFFYLALVFVIAGLAGLTGAAVGGFAVYKAYEQFPPATQAAVAPITAIPANSTNPASTFVLNATDVESAVTQAVQKEGPAVVTVVGTIPGRATFFGQTGDQTVSGSGVFISDKGYILTNNHVVEGTTTVSIILSDGTQEKVSLVGTDRYSDIAVLKVMGTVPAVAVLGNSDALKPGESVIAIGSPLGDFKNTVTAGVVSATGRSIDTGNGYQIEGLIQTDAAINQGNSGGPLVNLAGEVVAINTLIVRNSGSGTVAEGLGFAIPINTAEKVAQQIIEKGYYSRPNLGINYQSITPDIAYTYTLPVQWGVYVTQVAAGSPAATAGLQPGDIITSVGNVTLDENHSYLNTLFTFKAGDQINVGFVRNGQSYQVQVTLGESRSSS